jgi:hypothetical protein
MRNMRKKHSRSHLRRSNRGKSAKNGKRGVGLRIKTRRTRRMRGKGLFDWFSGSTGPAAGPSGPAGYSAVSQEETEPRVEFLPNVEFSDADGKKGKYTGYAINLDGVYFRKDPNGIMKYSDGSKYIGAFDRNMKNGQGTYYYDENTEVTGTWLDDKLIKQGLISTYDGNNPVKSVIYSEAPRVNPQLLESADAVTGYKRFDPRSISAMPTIPTFRPKSTL